MPCKPEVVGRGIAIRAKVEQKWRAIFFIQKKFKKLFELVKRGNTFPFVSHLLSFKPFEGDEKTLEGKNKCLGDLIVKGKKKREIMEI